MFRAFFKVCAIVLAVFIVNAGKQNELEMAMKQKKFVIDDDKGYSGLFSLFHKVVNSLIWCDKHGIKPVVYWHKNYIYYEEGAYGGIENVWEYYFEPVSDETYLPGDRIYSRYVAPDGTGIDAITMATAESHYNNIIQRRLRHNIINKYIKFKPYLREKIERFYEKHMTDKTTIGIHIRGTDKFTEIEPVNIADFLQKVNEKAKQFPNRQFLVATDEMSILAQAKKELNGPVIYYNCQRSLDGKPIHQPADQWVAQGVYNEVLKSSHKYNKALLGEEVIIEAALLSKCQLFFHTCSNVSLNVLFFNPDLEHVLIMNRKE